MSTIERLAERRRFGTARRWATIPFLALCALTCLAPRVLAQVDTASVTGIVRDPSGAIIPNAKLTLIDVEKGFTYRALSNSSGVYFLRNIPPGTYRLTVQSAGFRTWERSGIVLVVSQAATVDATLQVGSSVQTVQVSAAPPLLDTQNAQLGQTVDGKLIRELPLVNRDVTQLFMLSPGVTPPPGGACFACGGAGITGNNFVSDGMRNVAADMSVDGVTVNAYDYGVSYNEYSPSIDAVQEFKVQQNNFSAAIGFSGSTVVNMVLRSGTNQFHGTVYEFNRNNAYDANNFFNNAAGIAEPSLIWNDFGGTFGGPIQRNKTFFFADYEGSRQQTLNTFSAGVPSQAERNGDFSELCGEAGGPAPHSMRKAFARTRGARFGILTRASTMPR